jgi:hypothetical protein
MRRDAGSRFEAILAIVMSAEAKATQVSFSWAKSFGAEKPDYAGRL